MSRYTHRRTRPLRLIAMLLRGLARLISQWPLLLMVGLLISPVGPHLRIQYTYEQRGSYRHMLDCDYFGARGVIRHARFGECPFIIVLDSRAYR